MTPAECRRDSLNVHILLCFHWFTEALALTFPFLISQVSCKTTAPEQTEEIAISETTDKHTDIKQVMTPPPISRWRKEAGERWKAKKEANVREAPRWCSNSLVSYWFISRPWAPEKLPYWAHLRKNLYRHSPNWVPTRAGLRWMLSLWRVTTQQR